MTLDEVREIKEKMSLETTGMNPSELRSYYSRSAKKIQKVIDEIRAGSESHVVSEQRIKGL